MLFLNFGYYIIEPYAKPEWFKLASKQVITVSDCLCELHPSLRGTFWLNQNMKPYEKEQRDYQQLLKLPVDVFTELKKTVNQLYDEKLLDVDSRFTEVSDAISFQQKYLHNLSTMLISIALEDVFKNSFIQDYDELLNADLLKKEDVGGKFIGYDILGWDFNSYHSYLCNGLNEDISMKYVLEINEHGLIKNDYEQVKIFAEYLNDNDMGEPVNWLPFAVYKHGLIHRI